MLLSYETKNYQIQKADNYYTFISRFTAYLGF